MSTTAGVTEAFLVEHEAELVAFRRHLHAHPELSGQEQGTTDAVAERLALAGLDPRTLGVGTGLVCDVGDVTGPVVALRADIDALAMPDEGTAPYRSQVPGVAHACGHDVHTAVVLGAGLVLARLADAGTLPGGVRLLFEPSEEAVPGGAVDIVAEGHLKGVGAVFGLHCDPKTDVGVDRGEDRLHHLGLRPGGHHLTGPGGHTARPEQTVDLVRIAGEVITTLPRMIDARVAPGGEVRLVFGSVHSGGAANVIPAHAVITGSLRTHHRETWQLAEPTLREALAVLLDDSGARWTLDYTRGRAAGRQRPGGHRGAVGRGEGRAGRRPCAAHRALVGRRLVRLVPRPRAGLLRAARRARPGRRRAATATCTRARSTSTSVPSRWGCVCSSALRWPGSPTPPSPAGLEG